jgi:hypothetical protein
MAGCILRLDGTLEKMFSPIAYFMANNGMDLRFTLNCRRIAGSWSVKFGSVATPLCSASNFLAISYFMTNSLDHFSPHLFRRFDNLVVLP